MRFILIILSFLFFTINTAAQTLKIDSLKKELQHAPSLEKTVLTQLSLAQAYQRTNRDSSRFYSDKAVLIARNLKNDSLLAASFMRQAYTEYFNANDGVALTIMNKIDSLSKINTNIDQILIETKIYRSEISKFTFTLEGVLKAKDYLIEGLKIAQNINNTYLEKKMLQRIAAWHGFIAQEVEPQKHLDTSKTILLELLPYFQENNYVEMTANTFESLATVSRRLGDQNKGDYYDDLWMKQLRTLGDSSKIGEAYFFRGSSYRKRSNPRKGLAYLDSASAIYKRIGYPNDNQKKNLLRDYGYLYELNNDYKNAYESMQKALVLKDTIFREQNIKAGIEMESKYNAERKQQEIILLKSQNALAEQQKKNERNLMLGGLGLTTAAGIFLFLGYRNRKKTNDKLRELDATKSNFFANISHEFRTPLSLIAGPIEEQLQKETLSNQETQNLQAAQRNSNRLLILVDQLLDLSKLESGQLNLKVQQGNLSNFIKSLASVFKFQAAEKEQEYEVTVNIPETTYWFDADALEKITTNLLANAIKYSPNKATVWLEASIVQGALHLIISNSGVVLKKGVLETLFNRFQRADEQTTGSGIGLALTKELVELHKGSIKVSNDDNWMVFTTKIPVTAKAFVEEEKIPGTVTSPITTENDFAFAKASLADSQKSGAKSGKTKTKEEVDIFEKDTNPILLIVDDNEDLRVYLSSLFADHYTIKTAVNGKEGYGIAQKVVPDLIITDLMMPQEDGLIFTKNCKTNEATSHIPVLMLTAKAGDINELQGLQTGADAYITKPFSTEILKTTVLNLLDSRKKLQERYSQEVVLLPKDLATNSIEEKFLENLKTVLDDKLIESDFNTEDFAKALGMSRMQLHRKLKALTGLSATEFVRSQRLKLAAQLLKKSDINVSQVGYSVGFNNHSYFTKCFKEHYGVSPSEYVKKS